MQPLAGNQRPDLQTSLVKISPVLRLPREVHVCRPPANVSCLIVFELLQNHHGLDRFAPFCSLLTRCRIHCVCHKKNDGSTSKSGPNIWCFSIFTVKHALGHSRVHFFNISTSKSGPRPSVYVSIMFNSF